MKRTLLASVAIPTFFAAFDIAHAGGGPLAGKAKTAIRAGCFGANGEGVAPNQPLAGKTEDQIDHALQDYKSGKRANPVMKSLAGTLSDQDMSNIGTYCVSLNK